MRMCIWMDAYDTKKYDEDRRRVRKSSVRATQKCRVDELTKIKKESVLLHMRRVCHLVNSCVANAMACRSPRHKFRDKEKQERSRMCRGILNNSSLLALKNQAREPP